jgi:uncharacterized membrane protein
MRKLVAVLPIVLLSFNCQKKAASDSDTPSSSGPYFTKVKSIIQSNCISCHDPAGSWQGRPTDLSSDDKIVQAAAAIKAAVADPVTPTNQRMPQGGQLSQEDINTIVSWFNKGGKSTD